ncbi:MAG TPA: Ig-like domain-containing protein [Nitrospirota bacterium]|nr:Ig-like domain-containing protein [Nitrospirota bacterium]
MRNIIVRGVACMMLATALFGCGDVATMNSNGAALTSIAIAPANPSITTGASQQFTATGTYSDSTTQNITGSVLWSSSNASSATISTAGLASGVSAGTTTIEAMSGTIYGTTTLTVTVGTTTLTYGNMSGADLGAGANLNGAIPFPASNAWNTDISSAPVDTNSNALISSIGLGTGLHPDFGSGLWSGAPIGIPYVIVSNSQPMVSVLFTLYADESDPGPYPVPPNAPIEGQLANGQAFGGDRHVLVIDRDSNLLYEMANAYPQSDGTWTASCGAIFHLDSNNVRPTAQPGWTSSDAAGLPIFPGLVRYEEASSGVINHALRFTVNTTREAYVPPATHWASSNTNADLPPMGMRVRLKSTYVIPSGFSTEVKAILQALKTYGMFVADNGSDWFITGTPDSRWNNDELVSELGSVTGSNFEVVQMDGLVTP